MSSDGKRINWTDLAIDAEEELKNGISQGSASDFIQGYYKYEKAILFYEGVGKKLESQKLLARLEKILNVVIERGNPDGPYYSKLGPFFILYARHYKARILENLDIDLAGATASRVSALDYAIGVEWIEQVLNIMIDLLIEGYVDHCLRYLKFTKEKKDELIEELTIQIEDQMKERKWWNKGPVPSKAAVQIYNSFLHLLGLMVERYNKGTSFLTDGLDVLRKLKFAAQADLDYLDKRLMALEANIRAVTREEVNEATISHIKSKVIPYTIMDDPNLPKLRGLLRDFVKKKNINIDVAVGEIPILGANPAGTPHLSVIGQTGVGKTTLTKQIVRENIRAQDCAVVVFDHHFEYADIADHIIQFGGTRKEEATQYFGVEEIGDTFKQAMSFIQDQQRVFAAEGANPEDLAKKIRQYEDETRPTINRFVIDTIEGVLTRDEESALPIRSGEIVIFWIVMDDAFITTTIVSTLIKYILQMAIHNRLPPKTIMVTEEAQRLSGDQWIRNVTSEGRKFGLYLISISQVPEFDPWVVSNSELAIFRLRRIDDESQIAELFNPDARAMVTKLEVGEYLNYHRDKRAWVLSYNPESLSAIHAKETLQAKVDQLIELNSAR